LLGKFAESNALDALTEGMTTTRPTLVRCRGQASSVLPEGGPIRGVSMHMRMRSADDVVEKLNSRRCKDIRYQYSMAL